jgi:hypothetical protein
VRVNKGCSSRCLPGKRSASFRPEGTFRNAGDEAEASDKETVASFGSLLANAAAERLILPVVAPVVLKEAMQNALPWGSCETTKTR